MTVVFGLRWAVPLVTYRPVIADRYALPDPDAFPPDSVTVVRGHRAAALLETYRPVIADRWDFELLLFPRATGSSYEPLAGRVE